MNGSDIIYCAACGNPIVSWAAVCPWCDEKQSEWIDGEPVKVVNDAKH